MSNEVNRKIHDKLTAALAPSLLEVIDVSHLHAGHAGAKSAGQSHFTIKIVSEAFRGKSLVQCHRLVNEVLAEELAGAVHAISIKASPPEDQ